MPSMLTPPTRPDALEIEFDTWDGFFLALRLVGAAIVFRNLRYGSESRVEPSDQAWERFLDALDRLDVWAWKTDYTNSIVLDGSSWRIEIAARGRRVQACGSNGYPGQPLECVHPSQSFTDFQQAVRELLFENSTP